MSIRIGDVLERLDAEGLRYATSAPRDTALCGPVDWWSFSGEGLAFYSYMDPEPLRRWLGAAGSALIICREEMREQVEGGPFLFTDAPRTAFALAATLFVPPRRPGIHPSAVIDPEAQIGANACIGPFAVIGAARIGDDACILDHVTITDHVTLGDGATIMSGARIGLDGLGSVVDTRGRNRLFPHFASVEAGDGLVVGPNSVVSRGVLTPTRIGHHSHFSACCSVGHNVVVGDGVFCAPGVSIAGRAQIGDGCIIGHGSVVNDALVIPPDTLVGGNVAVTRAPTEPGQTIVGVPARNIGRIFRG
jgi:UDP-3-O-[3-hydroxymyristoyl] glucosamine N-acyltransferase